MDSSKRGGGSSRGTGSKKRGADASKRGAGSNKRGGGSSRGGVFGSDVYRPPPLSQHFPTQHQQLPIFFPPQQYYYSQPIVPPVFSNETMNNFEPFASYRSQSHSSPSENADREPPLYVDDDDDEYVQETQFNPNMEEINMESEDHQEDEAVEEQGNKSRKFANRAERVEWSPKEEVMLAKAYIHCKYDRQHGNQQRRIVCGGKFETTSLVKVVVRGTQPTK